MKKTLLSILCILVYMVSQAQIDIPIASPKASVSTRVGLTDVSVNYYRPKVNGRKIFGKGDEYLLPFGKVWRSGANSGSKVTFSTDVTFGGSKVKAGEYLLFTIPNQNNWEVMLYSDLSIGGNVGSYDKEKEVMRTTVKAEKSDKKIETLTFNITDVSEDNTTANLALSWEYYTIKVAMSVDFDNQVMEAIKKGTNVNPSNYTAAANYYLSTNKDLNQALEWMNLYLAQGENSKQFWHLYTKARILAKMGKKDEAVKISKQSISLAENSPNGDFGYIDRNKKLISSLK